MANQAVSVIKAAFPHASFPEEPALCRVFAMGNEAFCKIASKQATRQETRVQYSPSLHKNLTYFTILLKMSSVVELLTALNIIWLSKTLIYI